MTQCNNPFSEFIQTPLLTMIFLPAFFSYVGSADLKKKKLEGVRILSNEITDCTYLWFADLGENIN